MNLNKITEHSKTKTRIDSSKTDLGYNETGEIEEEHIEDSSPKGKRFGKYILVKKLGSGGMGTVYKAYHPSLDSYFAMKMVLSSLGSDGLKRFEREAKLASKLKHPNIAQVHDVGELNGKHYMVMDYIDGEDIRHLIEKERFWPRRALEITLNIAQALQYAHSQGVIHRDIKPANIMIKEENGKETPYLMDFGLASAVKEEGLTRSGQLLGTPQYMSPEQARGLKNMDERSDIYSLGTVIYEMLSGKPVVEDNQTMAVIYDVLEKDPIPLSKHVPGISRDIESIVTKCLEKEPLRRYQKAEELAKDIERYLRGEAVLARSPGLLSRLWRKVKRNWKFTSVIAGLILFIICGLIWWRVNENIKDKEADKKQQEFEKNKFLTKRDNLCDDMAKFDKEALELYREYFKEYEAETEGTRQIKKKIKDINDIMDQAKKIDNEDDFKDFKYKYFNEISEFYKIRENCHREARKYYDMAMEVLGPNPNLRVKEINNCVELLKKAIQADPIFGEAYYQTGRALHRLLKTKEYLFSIDIKYANDLENGKIAEKMRTIFENNGKPLSPNACIEVTDKGSKWVIKDNEKYQVKLEKNGLMYSKNESDKPLNIYTNDDVKHYYNNSLKRDSIVGAQYYLLNIYTNDAAEYYYNNSLKYDPTLTCAQFYLSVAKMSDFLQNIERFGNIEELNFIVNCENKLTDIFNMVWKVKETYIFSIEANLKSELNQATIPEILINKFHKHKIALSKDTIVEITKKDDEWRIVSELSKFTIKREGEMLKIYENDEKDPYILLAKAQLFLSKLLILRKAKKNAFHLKIENEIPYREACKTYCKMAIESTTLFPEAYFIRAQLNSYLMEISAETPVTYVSHNPEELEEAIKDCDEVIRLLPYRPEGYELRGTIFKSLGAYDLAIKDYSDAFKIKKGFGYAFYANRAICYVAMGKYTSALEDLEMISEKSPKALFWLAFLKACIKDKEGAEENLDKYMKNFIFDMDIKYLKDMENREVSDDLRYEFYKKKKSLPSKKLSVKEIDKRLKWEILNSDNERLFYVINNGNRLTICCSSSSEYLIPLYKAVIYFLIDDTPDRGMDNIKNFINEEKNWKTFQPLFTKLFPPDFIDTFPEIIKETPNILCTSPEFKKIIKEFQKSMPRFSSVSTLFSGANESLEDNEGLDIVMNIYLKAMDTEKKGRVNSIFREKFPPLTADFIAAFFNYKYDKLKLEKLHKLKTLPSASLCYRRASDNYLNDKFSDAQKDLEEAVKLDPDFMKAHYGLSTVCSLLINKASPEERDSLRGKAINHLRKAIETGWEHLEDYTLNDPDFKILELEKSEILSIYQQLNKKKK